MFSINNLRLVPVALALAGAFCAFTVPQALAGGTTSWPDVFERYAAEHPFGRGLAQSPDVFERYAAEHPFGRGVSQPPDVFERYATSHPHGEAVPTPQRVGLPLYTPAMLAAHYHREDLLYRPRPSLRSSAGPTVSTGFDWSDWAIGIGTGLGLALILAGGLLMGRHLRRRHIQPA